MRVRADVGVVVLGVERGADFFNEARSLQHSEVSVHRPEADGRKNLFGFFINPFRRRVRLGAGENFVDGFSLFAVIHSAPQKSVIILDFSINEFFALVNGFYKKIKKFFRSVYIV